MIMTTPNEFLRFAKEMGLGSVKSTLSFSPARSMPNDNGYQTTGLYVLNNLCRLIEQIHQLKRENDRLRAHLELVNHVEKFQQRFLSTDNHENRIEKNEQIISITSVPDEEKSLTLSPSNSLKIKQFTLNRKAKGLDFRNNNDESSSLIQTDHDRSEMIDSGSGLSYVTAWHNWSKVRHAFKFSIRRKQDSPNSPPLIHTERQIPTISFSVESDDDPLQHNKRQKKKKKITTLTTTTTNNNNQRILTGDDTDQEDEPLQFATAYHKRRLDGNETANSSSTDRQEISSANPSCNTSAVDDEVLLTRKQSKIARYRRKLRSKLDTVKRQFIDQSTPTSFRGFHNPNASTFDDIGSGVNHAMLTAQLAPALTKSYQQKMRDWETMQKSDFLVNYRRKSITPKIDPNSNSRKNSITLPINTITSEDPRISSLKPDKYHSTAEDLNVDIETSAARTLGPILSANQRSLIVHQWREIMSEELSLRHYNEYLQEKMLLLKGLEGKLKILKTNIFCSNNQTNSTEELHQYKQTYTPQRCRSLQSLISIPTSWILAVQSAAYSDVLDGTSNKTTERAILLNKTFFDQLEHFKQSRKQFQIDSIKDLQLLNHSKTNRSNQCHAKLVLTRVCLRKLSLISSSEFPQYFLPDPVIPLQTSILPLQTSSNIELYSTLLTSSNNLNKPSKRSRFDFKKTYQRSKSMCISQINSWFHRRRQQQQQQQHSSVQRRKSAVESEILTPCSTPKLFGSPRLARLHQRIFKHQHSSSPTDQTQLQTELLENASNYSQYDLPVRIYFPPLTSPTSRHVRITENCLFTSNDGDDQDIQSEQTTPIINRKYSSLSSFKITTAKERRESFATMSNIFHHRFL